MRYVELRRHTDNEGDRLTPQGVADAEMIGRGGLHPPYAAFVSTGAARATQMLEILRHAAGQDDTPITAATGLRSSVEDRWRDAARQRASERTWRTSGPSTRTWSSESLCCSPRCYGRWRRDYPRAAGRWWRAIAPPARPPCSGSPAGSSRHWARAKGFCWSMTAGTTGWNRCA